MQTKTRLIARFDQDELGGLTFEGAKEMVADWVANLPERLLGLTRATRDRRELLQALRLRYTSDAIEYCVVDPQLNELSLGALRDNLEAFARGWCQGAWLQGRALQESF